ncbi:hypothetical protein [Streptomyces sp. NPDC056682]|uniref:hypothetical protein n=1 Tax=Streptomyces sp. NPDC056682 TaxID=3345909 RepID=UPI0036BEB4F8
MPDDTVMSAYASEHPRAALLLCPYLGLWPEGSAKDFRSAGHRIHFVRLESGPAPPDVRQAGTG